MSIDTRRRYGLIGLAIVGLVLCILPWLLFWNDLPPTLSSGFGFDGASPAVGRSSSLWGILALAAIGAGGVIFAAYVPRRRDWAPPASSAAIGGFLLGIAVGVSVATVWAGRGAGDASSTWQRLVGPLLVLALAMAFSVAARRLARQGPAATSSTSADDPQLALAPGEQAVWVGSATQPLLWIVTAALVLVGLVIAFSGEVAPGLVAAAIGVIVGAAFARIRVLVDRTGVTVRYTALSWPSTHVDLPDIEAASAIDVRPRRWGGWGYRGSLRAFGSAAVVVRSGPGLRLDLTKGRTFVVTVDHPEGAADLVAAEIDRQRVRHET